MADMREGFREITAGWMMVNTFDDVTDRIERVAKWMRTNGPLLPDEDATIKYMIECQIARSRERRLRPILRVT